MYASRVEMAQSGFMDEEELRRMVIPTVGRSREEFLAPLDMSPGALAKACGVPRTRIERIAGEATGITADTALRLSRVFGTTAEFWLNLQRTYDLATARNAAGDLSGIKPVKAA